MGNKPINRIKVMLTERMISGKESTLENLIEVAKHLNCTVNDLVRTE